MFKFRPLACALTLLSLSCTVLAANELDYSHKYEQYQYDPQNSPKASDLYLDGYQREEHHSRPESDNFGYGRDRYYGQERPRPYDKQDEVDPNFSYPNYPEFAYPNRPHPIHPPRPPHHPSYPGHGGHRPSNPAFNGAIRACVAFEQSDGTYSKDLPLSVDILDGLALSRSYRIDVNGNFNDLYIVFAHPQMRTHVIVPLEHRKNLSTASTVLNDIHGNTWRLSRTWKRCLR